MKTLEQIKNEAVIKYDFENFNEFESDNELSYNKLSPKIYKSIIDEVIKQSFEAGLKYGIYIQGGSYDHNDDMDFEDYIKTLNFKG